jgi:uncharacterized protein (TIGR03437 family)
MMMRLGRVGWLLAAATAWPLAAQVWDISGNGLLNGTYYFREVAYVVGDNAGDLDEAVAVYGNINFDGHGRYTITGTSLLDSSNGAPQSYSTSGTYSISASGYGFLSNPISKGDTVYGLVSQGIFAGSSTETGNGFNDLFVAAPLASPAPTTAFLQGSYSVAYMNFTGTPAQDYDALFTMSPNGQGNVGTVNFTAYVGAGGSKPIPLSQPGVTYSFSNGAAVLRFPNTSNGAITGQEYMYFSPDGNFVFGGSPTGFDMFVGVRTTGATTPNFGGLYYQAGLDEDASTLANGYATLDTYYGSFSANDGTVVGHQRILSPFESSAYDYTYSGGYTVNSNGTASDSSTQYVFGNGGAVRIGLGIGPYLGISVALAAPSFSGPGVYLNPTGVLNAASSAPFTSGIARGELITLVGTNLAPSTMVVSTAPFPPMFDGVQVMINNVAAPIYYVSQTQIAAIVPYATNSSIAQIQVQNNGVASNAVTTFVNLTAPGVFTQPAGGLGYAVAQHPDYSQVTPDHPAQAGEILSVYVTGLGDVFPAIADGSAGPSDTPSQTTSPFGASIGGMAATVSYNGLAPQLAGLYQINVQVPTGVGAGDKILAISGPDSFTAEALIPVGTAP